jgi:hypothetical protein
MAIPGHGPDFWDGLAGAIDHVEDRAAARRRATASEPSRDLSAAIPPQLRPAAAPHLRPATPPSRTIPVDPRRVVVDHPDDLASDPGVSRRDVTQERVGPAGEPAAASPVAARVPAFGARPDSARPDSTHPDRTHPDRARPDGTRPESAHRRSPAGTGPRRRDDGRHTSRPRVRVEHDLAVVPRAMRDQRSNAVLAVMAVAAVALVVFAGGTLVRQRSGTGGGGETLEATNTAFNADALAANGDDPAARAVLAWVSQLGGGDADASWASLGPASQAHFGDRQAFDDEFDALREGYGAWADTTADIVLVTPLTASDAGTVSIVTLIGTVDGDQRADAIAVRIAGGVAQVEAFADAGAIGLVTPDASQGAEVPLDADLAVLVPAGVDTPIIRLDQGAPQRCGEAPGTSLEPAGGAKQRCTFTPAGGMQAGGRVLTVAFTSGDGGEISARSVRFKAA